jgi:acyl carrier protein
MYDKVLDLIASQLPVKRGSITRESRLLEDLGADSANVMILVMDLEQRLTSSSKTTCWAASKR